MTKSSVLSSFEIYNDEIFPIQKISFPNRNLTQTMQAKTKLSSSVLRI